MLMAGAAYRMHFLAHYLIAQVNGIQYFRTMTSTVAYI